MKIIFILLLGLMTTVHFNENAAGLDEAQEGLPLSIKELRNAPAEIVLEGKSLSLSAYPWRDFMPSTSWGSEGSPLMIGLKVTTSDEKSFPAGVRIDRVWVIFDDQVWEVSNLRTQGKSPADNQPGWINCSEPLGCQATIREGPRWGPGVQVDVVVRIIDREGQQYLIQSPRQKIIATH